MKILQYFGTTSLLSGAGGARKVFCDMANAFAERGHEVYAVCNEYRTGRPIYPLDRHVHFINLDGSGRRRIKPLTWFKGIQPLFPAVCKNALERYLAEPANLKKGAPLIKLIDDVWPDIVIPYFADDYFSMLHRTIRDVPVILMHHNSAEDFFQWVNTPRKIEQLNTCPHIQVLSASFTADIQKIYYGSLHVIPNGVPQIPENELSDLTANKSVRIITMISRLQHKKQQHLLIEAFGMLAKSYPQWKVEIYGSPSKQQYIRKLQQIIAGLALERQVELKGPTDRPLEILRHADIFAFPSSSEGFGLALTEAMAAGLPCIGLATTPSVSGLIDHLTDGLLSDNCKEDFAEKLKMLMDDQDLRVKLGRAGHEKMKQYAPEIIWNQWENLIETVVKQHQYRRED